MTQSVNTSKPEDAALEDMQEVLKRQKRERLKAAARELASSTPEEQAAFLEHVHSKPWSPRE